MSAEAEQRAYLLELDPSRVGELYARAGVEVQGDPVELLAQALASSAPLDEVGPWALAVRTGSPSVLGAVGSFTAGSVPRLEAIRWQVEQSLERLRYLDDGAVAVACERLADRLKDALGSAELSEARFTAIPRGGHLVLGRLAYLLDLKPGQLSGPDGGRPWVVVDDCSISGLRFRELLDEGGRGGVVFAHLCSHPDLRRTVESDPRVRSCLAALDLHDHAPEALGQEHEAWRARWEARQPGQHFWLGKPDHVSFPWNEPDTGIWNPVLQREDPGWRVVPPAFCLKNQVRFAKGAVDLQIHRSSGPLGPARGVVHADLGDRVVLARAGMESAVSLETVGADMWRSLTSLGTLSSAQKALADLYEVEASTLEADLTDFVASLRSAGLLDDSPLPSDQA